MPDASRLPYAVRALLVLLLVSPPACDRIPGLDDGVADAAPAETTAVPPEPEVVEVPPSEPLPERIYFNLTDYEWYAAGEPLVYRNAEYNAATGVIAAPLSRMRQVGEYQGVDVYAAEGESEDSTLYVPVYPGYWQPFHISQAAAPAAPGT